MESTLPLRPSLAISSHEHTVQHINPPAAKRGYIYEPLDRGQHEIRLVTLHASESFSSQVKCSIRKTALDSSEKYVALSYCWGSNQDPISIRLEGALFPVTANLYFAMRRLRSKKIDVAFWIDALCINQADIPERNHQVVLMRDIYERAECTFVWLGESSKNSSLAVGLIHCWSKYFKGDRPEQEALKEFIAENPTALKTQAWNAMINFLWRPWWSRLWVCQEFVVSKEVMFVCGHQMFHNDRMNLALNSWSMLSTSIASQGVYKDASMLPFMINDGPYRKLRRQRLARALWKATIQHWEDHPDAIHANPMMDLPERDLRTLLSTSAHMKASDPRDMIYGLIGLVEAEDITITPDYSKSVSDVYSDFAIQFMERKSDLSLLSLAGIGFPGRDPSLPSWVPDLRAYRSANQLFEDRSSHTSTQEPEFHFSSDSPSLTAKGIICDCVVAKETLDTGPTAAVYATDKLLPLVLNASDPHPVGINQIQAFFRTLSLADFSNERSRDHLFDVSVGFLKRVGSKCYDTLCADGNLKEKVVQWKEVLKGTSDYALGLAMYSLLKNELPDVPVAMSDEQLLEPFLYAKDPSKRLVWPRTYERDATGGTAHELVSQYILTMKWVDSFFITEKGYQGMLDAEMEVGDKVCILFGSKLPVLLRKCGDYYRFVGACYIYGMMEGELDAELEAGRLHVEDIVII